MNYNRAIQNYNNLSKNAKEAVKYYTTSFSNGSSHHYASHSNNGRIPSSIKINDEMFYAVEIKNDYAYNNTNENMIIYHNNMYVMINTDIFIPVANLA